MKKTVDIWFQTVQEPLCALEKLISSDSHVLWFSLHVIRHKYAEIQASADNKK